MTEHQIGALPEPRAQVMIDGQLVTVVAVTPNLSGADLVYRRGDGSLDEASLDATELALAHVPANDAGGHPERALTSLWGRWMQYAVPRIRSAVLATRPLQPYAHQDEAVFTHMLAQPRLRFLLADEPGTGKTIMTGMYLAEGIRRGLIPGRTVIIVPAHLIEKWRRDLRRYFAVQADRLTPELARDPKDLDPRVSVWIVSVDLYTYNTDVRRKISGARTSWSLTVFDEAHRLTPTSQYLTAAREVSARTHHLLLLTATPHRGKEHFFRGLLNLLDPTLYPWDPQQTDYDAALRPSTLSFLRRMKEELKDLDGRPLFPARYAETVQVDLTGPEDAAYTAVMDYVDTFYGEKATLARSIYGKRAGSSIIAAMSTIRRREEAVRGPASARTDLPVPEEFVGTGADLQFEVPDDDAWRRAEDAIVTARSRDKSKEIERITSVLETLDRAATEPPTKWLRALELLERHGIRPGKGQLLVFTEFADTARWLTRTFSGAGFTVDTLDGTIDHDARDQLQQRFLNGRFQALISTDAGGEGIDLQSAHVMLNWDVPWSLVRLEQRMGRLHRIGQKRPVHIYHLVAPATREGRVQEVALQNLEAAGQSLGGRIFDLLDATAARAGFDYGRALIEAQRSSTSIHPVMPGAKNLLEAARELVADEDRLHTPANTVEAMARFRADRLEAINPVIVDAFVDQLARARNWALGPGPAKGIREITAQQPLPPALGGGLGRLVAADGASVRQAINDGAHGLDDVVVLGPTEEPFGELVDLALHEGETELVRGTRLTDTAALTGYTLLIYDAEVEAHDGVRRHRRKAPLLIRYSGAGAFEIAWESLMTLRSSTVATTEPTPTLPPATRSEGMAQARVALAREVERVRAERTAWLEKAFEQLDQVEYRYLDELDELPAEIRRDRHKAFSDLKAERLRQLKDIGKVTGAALRLAGWAQVAAGARSTELGYDPDSEAVAIATVLEELERFGYIVDDRQTAGIGYDLFAHHPQTGEQRLVEVKGLQAGLEAIWLEQHEWAQAQQRGEDYWLYLVTNCSTIPEVILRAQDPADRLTAGPRRIERFRIKVTDLRRMMRGEQ
jgi:superfamily II DNA or RNA helicase